jgi:hypothetical protein
MALGNSEAGESCQGHREGYRLADLKSAGSGSKAGLTGAVNWRILKVIAGAGNRHDDPGG